MGASGRTLLPQIFGWMVHVYPFEQTPEKIWSQRRGESIQPTAISGQPRAEGNGETEKGRTGEILLDSPIPRFSRSPIPTFRYAAFGNEAGVTIGVSALRRTHQVSWMPIVNASPRTQRPRTTTMPTKSGAKSAVMSRVPVGIAESDGTYENICPPPEKIAR